MWLLGECADWFFYNITTSSYCMNRRYSMSRQKNSILINEHALNREPVPLTILCKIFLGKTNWIFVINHVLENKVLDLWVRRDCPWCVRLMSTVWYLSDMWLFTSEIGKMQLYTIAEIMLKSPFLCVIAFFMNRSAIWYGFQASTEAIW